MVNPEPCLCGDPECPACFPGAGAARRREREEARAEREEQRADEARDERGPRTNRDE